VTYFFFISLSYTKKKGILLTFFSSTSKTEPAGRTYKQRLNQPLLCIFNMHL